MHLRSDTNTTNYVYSTQSHYKVKPAEMPHHGIIPAWLTAQLYTSELAIAQKDGSSTANDTFTPAPLINEHCREYSLVASSKAYKYGAQLKM